MKPVEHTPKTPHVATRIFVALRGLLDLAGIGMPKMASSRRLALPVCATAFAALALASAPALAAAPETPEVQPPVAVRATTAVLLGVLDPGKEGAGFEGGTYEFVYRQSASECKGAGEVRSPEGLALGVGKQEVSQSVEGLTAGTTYSVCLVEHNETKTEAAMSAEVTFTTAIPPETPLTLAAQAVTGTTAKLEGVLNPKHEGNAGTYEFVYQALTGSCVGNQEQRTPEPPAAAAGHSPEAVAVEATKLIPDTTYTFCLRARNAAGEETLGSPQTFTTTVQAPMIGTELAPSVASTAATLTAQIGPGGLPTSYRVEYGKSGGPYEASTPEVELSAAREPVGVLVQLTGLQPSASYHFRFVASNSQGAAAGSEASFTTDTSGTAASSASALPDGRAYELVSPPGDLEVYAPESIEANGGRVTAYPYRAAADGSAIAYVSDPPPVGGNGYLVGGGVGNDYLAERAANGWTSSDITPAPHAAGGGPVEEYQTIFYQSFTSDLAMGIVTSAGQEAQLTAGASPCDRVYSYTRADAAFHALFTTAQVEQHCFAQQTFAGASADDSHVLIESDAALTAQAAEPAEEQDNLYDAVDGQLHLVNVLPDGEVEPTPNAAFGRPSTAGRYQQADFSNVVSADGSRVFWTDMNRAISAEDPAGTTRLFVRENDMQPQSPIGAHGECTVSTDACTVQLDAQQGGTGSGGGGRFWTASSDGSRVFFTDCNRLTEDSTAVPSGGCEAESGSYAPVKLFGNDLYEYNFEAPPGKRLTDLTVDRNGHDPLGADVQGVVDASEDGSYVYFIASAALAPGAESRNCNPGGSKEENEEEEEGKIPPGKGCNLYLLHRGEPVKFVAVLSPLDSNLPGISVNLSGTGYSDWAPNLNGRTAQVTPSGHQLVFESLQSPTLTGYDNTFPSSSGRPRPEVEVMVYDADNGQIACASCNSSGAVSSNGGTRLPAGLQTTYQPRWLSDDGNRVFFETSQALIPQDTNGQEDVYEWERGGAGSCTQDAGCVYLLSGGTSDFSSLFAEASASGDDVFFTTRSQLIPSERGESVKLFDARVGGGFPVSSLACTGTGCQGVPPAAPIFATPASVTFGGIGNFPPPTTARPQHKPLTRGQKLTGALKACARTAPHRRGRERAGCEARARKRYGAKRRVKRSAKGRK